MNVRFWGQGSIAVDVATDVRPLVGDLVDFETLQGAVQSVTWGRDQERPEPHPVILFAFVK